MKQSDLITIEKKYDTFNALLFNKVLPPAKKINFILENDMDFCAGYSKYEEKPINGKIHTIAFAEMYIFTDKQITEILIHEMIHVWQLMHVKEDRYKMCSNSIAHDRVFIGKMKTINLMLQKFGYQYVIDEKFKDELVKDPDFVPPVKEEDASTGDSSTGTPQKKHAVIKNGRIIGIID